MSLATPAGARSMLQGRGRVAPAPSFASFTGCVGLVGLLLALASTAVAAAPPADVRLSARGIGPLVLSVPAPAPATAPVAISTPVVAAKGLPIAFSSQVASGVLSPKPVGTF